MNYKILNDGRVYPDKHPIDWDIWMVQHHVKLKGSDNCHEENERNAAGCEKSLQRAAVENAG